MIRLAFISVLLLSLVRAEFVVVVMNDVHLDLKYWPRGNAESQCHSYDNREPTIAHYGRRGCDSPITLLRSTLKKMLEVEPNPDLIIVPGDLVTHSLPQKTGPFSRALFEDLKFTLSIHAQLVAEVFFDTPIVFTQGNDDYPVNYHVPNVTMRTQYYTATYEYFIKKIKVNQIAVILLYDQYRIPKRIDKYSYAQAVIQ